MIYRGLELHNVWDVQETGCGAILQRFPEKVRLALEKRRNFRAENCAGVEIRFCTDGWCTEIVLECLYGSGWIQVFRGPHQYASAYAEGGRTLTLHLELPEAWDSLNFGDEPVWKRNVWRIQLPPMQFAIRHVESYGSSIRPPKKEERPEKTLMAYGSSITQGCYAQNNSLSYVQYAAMRLGWDVYNFGLSGACYCEPEMAKFISKDVNWDMAFLELGVNMRGFFSEEEFGHRAKFLIEEVCVSHPDKPVVMTTIFPNIEPLCPSPTLLKEREDGYCRILRELADTLPYSNLHLVEGTQILDNLACLGADLIHPTDFGHVVMGENLFHILSGICSEQERRHS